MGYFLNEPNRQELLHLLADGPALFLIELAHALLHRSGAGRMSKACSATSLGMLGMSEGLHANMSAFTWRKSTSMASYLMSRVALILSARSSE